MQTALLRSPALAALLLCLTSAPAVIARTPLADDSVAHTVQPGDTLEGLARHYLNAPQQWPLLQKRNAVANPRQLRPGSVLHIPAHLLPSAPAQIAFVQGDVRTLDKTAAAQPLQAGSTVPEGTRLQVGAESFVAVRLADGSVVRVPAQSDVQLQQMRRTGRTGQVRAVIELRSGGLDAEVTPNKAAQDTPRRFEIRTPRAATSVRGTRFGVMLASDGRSSTSVLEGSVAVQTLAGAPRSTRLDPGQGVAVAADGTLGTVRNLLPAPDLSGVPAAIGEAGIVALALSTQSAGAVSYQVQIARDEGLSHVLRNGVFAPDTIRLQGLPDGQYTLAVRALDADGMAGPFAQRPLTIKTQPVAPLYQSPPPGATVASSGAFLHCTEVPGIGRFHLQVSRRADFAELAQDAPHQSRCQLQTSALPVGPYYWRAASVQQLADGTWDTGPFAAPQPFNVAERPSALPAQALQAEQHAQTLQLHWPAQLGQTFRLQCARDMAFADLACDETLPEPRWLATALTPGPYFVRLQTRDPSGLESEFSAPRRIYVGSGGLQTGDGLGVSTSDGQPIGRH